jgi:hypothetical protein
MNHALSKPARYAIILLGVVMASGLLIRGNTSSNNTALPSDAEEQAPRAVETLKAAETRTSGDPGRDGAAFKASDPASAGETSKTSGATKAGDGPQAAATQETGNSPDKAGERRQLLESVGVLTAAHCYQTYLNVNLIADGKNKGTYTDKDAYKLLVSVLSLQDSVDRKLAALGQIDLDKDDRESLEQMRILSDLLHQQGKQLETYWESGKDEDAAKYESARKDSWAAIGKLTGIGR